MLDEGATMDLQSQIEGISLAPEKLPVAKFDKMIDFITEEQSIGWIGSIIQAVKLLCVCAFIIARQSLVASEIKDKQRKLESLIRQRNRDANEIID